MISTPLTEDVFVLMDERNPILLEVILKNRLPINLRANSIKQIRGMIYFFCDERLMFGTTEDSLEYFRPVPTMENQGCMITDFITSHTFLSITDKIQRIKMLRAKFNLPLKEAKEIVDTGKVPV